MPESARDTQVVAARLLLGGMLSTSHHPWHAAAGCARQSGQCQFLSGSAMSSFGPAYSPVEGECDSPDGSSGGAVGSTASGPVGRNSSPRPSATPSRQLLVDLPSTSLRQTASTGARSTPSCSAILSEIMFWLLSPGTILSRIFSISWHTVFGAHSILPQACQWQASRNSSFCAFVLRYALPLAPLSPAVVGSFICSTWSLSPSGSSSRLLLGSSRVGRDQGQKRSPCGSVDVPSLLHLDLHCQPIPVLLRDLGID